MGATHSDDALMPSTFWEREASRKEGGGGKCLLAWGRGDGSRCRWVESRCQWVGSRSAEEHQWGEGSDSVYDVCALLLEQRRRLREPGWRRRR